jgi:hypothetical protein
MSFLARCLFLAALAAPIACGGSSHGSVTMADAFDLDIFGAHVNELHTPYVAGASFNITVGSDDPRSGAGWTLSSSDPDVIRVTSPLLGGSATVGTRRPGQATLSVIDESGAVLTSRVVTVAVPDQVNLYAQGLLLTGAPDSVAQLTQASVVRGGEATFLARYFSQGTELYGNGVLQSTATAGVTTTTVSPVFASDRDFLQIAPSPESEPLDVAMVSLLVDQAVVGQVPITVVDGASITHVTVLPQPTDNPQQGDSLLLYAHAVDETSTEVYGASFSWRVDGQASWESQPADGGFVDSSSAVGSQPADLFFYTFDPSATETVAAELDGFAPQIIVHGHGGTVGSTAEVGCSVAVVGAHAGLPTWAPGFTLLSVLSMMLRRRR